MVQATSVACSLAFVRSSSGNAGNRTDEPKLRLDRPPQQLELVYHLPTYCRHSVESGMMARQTGKEKYGGKGWSMSKLGRAGKENGASEDWQERHGRETN